MYIKIFLSILFVINFTGCISNSTLPINEVKRSGINAIIMDNSAKVTYIKEHNHIDRYCASRESDSDKTSSQGIGFGLSTGTTGENIGENSTDGALSLGGRSPTVLITRELMYRACELSMNLNTDTKSTIELYKMFLNSIESITRYEHDIGSKPMSAIPQSGSILNPSNKKNKTDDDDDDD